jgi:AcrR family transcriptional regulator
MQPTARECLLESMLTELAEHGYGGIEVADVLTLSGIAKADFEAEFVDKDACLFAAYQQLTERLTRKASENCDREEDWPARVRGGLEGLLEELARAPGLARVAVRVFPEINPAARARYQDFVAGFAPLLREGRGLAKTGTELPEEVEMLAVGAAEAIVFEEVEAGRAALLPALGPAILFSVLVPFLGPETASAEMAKAQQLQ